MNPDEATIRGLKRWCAISMMFITGACTTMSEQEQKDFLCEEWAKGTKNIDQLKATYSFATGEPLRLRSGGPRTGISYIEGDLNQLVLEVDTACGVQAIGRE